MRKWKLTSFGIEIKMKLIGLGETQEWLIEQIKLRTGLYMDSSYLYKLMTGQSNNPKLKAVIEDILQIKASA